MIIELQQKEVNVVSGGILLGAALMTGALTFVTWYNGACAQKEGIIGTSVCYAFNGLVIPGAAVLTEVLNAKGVNGASADAHFVEHVGYVGALLIAKFNRLLHRHTN